MSTLAALPEPATARLQMLIHAYKFRVEDGQVLNILRKMDQDLAMVVVTTAELLEVDAHTIRGFLGLTLAINQRMSELGYSHFTSDNMQGKALEWLTQPERTAAEFLHALNGPFKELRARLWSSVPEQK